MSIFDHVDVDLAFPPEPGRLLYPGIVRPSVGSKGELGGKEMELVLPHLSVEERIQKYFEFCRAFDEREDPVLRDHFQQHSHRLHWHEHPFRGVIRQVTSLRDKIWFTLVFSFTNEHWGSLMTVVEGGKKALAKRFEDPTVRHARSDLFQIYYPKGTKVRDWLVHNTKQAADDMVDNLQGRNRPFGMMNLAYMFAEYFEKCQGFRTVVYPCKNFARYLAMAHPEIVDPDSYIHPGTGSFRGLHQIFGGKYLMSRAKFSVDGEGKFVSMNEAGEELHGQFMTLIKHPDNPVHTHQYINHEDKACFFFKRLAYEVGVQKATSAIPYTRIFPANWNLRTGKYDRDPTTPEFMI